MKIRIYINEKDKIMCHIPGEPKDMLFIEFAMGVGLGNADKIKENPVFCDRYGTNDMCHAGDRSVCH